jgi:hypothetical protein
MGGILEHNGDDMQQIMSNIGKGSGIVGVAFLVQIAVSTVLIVAFITMARSW